MCCPHVHPSLSLAGMTADPPFLPKYHLCPLLSTHLGTACGAVPSRGHSPVMTSLCADVAASCAQGRVLRRGRVMHTGSCALTLITSCTEAPGREVNATGHCRPGTPMAPPQHLPTAPIMWVTGAAKCPSPSFLYIPGRMMVEGELDGGECELPLDSILLSLNRTPATWDAPSAATLGWSFHAYIVNTVSTS